MDLKTTFIQKTLTEFMKMGADDMRRAGRAKKVGKTGEGLSGIDYQTSPDGAGAKGSLMFREYLRFVDMGVGRGHPLGGLKAMRVALQASKKEGIAQMKDRTIKPKKIYAKPVYTNLGWLYGKLLYGYTEETVAMLKKELNNGSTTD